nr:immunoglobulin light chain junction region [Macaca mulatta]MPO00431.1 immunoglobulin light chain junction region [Macaca mulatta]
CQQHSNWPQLTS